MCGCVQKTNKENKMASKKAWCHRNMLDVYNNGNRKLTGMAYYQIFNIFILLKDCPGALNSFVSFVKDFFKKKKQPGFRFACWVVIFFWNFLMMLIKLSE